MTKNETLIKIRKLEVDQQITMLTDYDKKLSSQYAGYCSKNFKLYCRVETEYNAIVVRRIK